MKTIIPTRDESREMATDVMATSTTKLTHSFLLIRLHSSCSCFIKNADNLASLGAATGLVLLRKTSKLCPGTAHGKFASSAVQSGSPASPDVSTFYWKASKQIKSTFTWCWFYDISQAPPSMSV